MVRSLGSCVTLGSSENVVCGLKRLYEKSYDSLGAKRLSITVEPPYQEKVHMIITGVVEGEREG